MKKLSKHMSLPDGVLVLSVSDSETTQSKMRDIFSSIGWKLHECGSSREALEMLRHHSIGVVIHEDAVFDGCWKDFLAAARELPEPPLLIVTSRRADERLWAEVLSFGAYDLLAAPLMTSEVTRTVSLAWLHWDNQWKGAGREIAVEPAELLAVAGA